MLSVDTISKFIMVSNSKCAKDLENASRARIHVRLQISDTTTLNTISTEVAIMSKRCNHGKSKENYFFS